MIRTAQLEETFFTGKASTTEIIELERLYEQIKAPVQQHRVLSLLSHRLQEKALQLSTNLRVILEYGEYSLVETPGQILFTANNLEDFQNKSGGLSYLIKLLQLPKPLEVIITSDFYEKNADFSEYLRFLVLSAGKPCSISSPSDKLSQKLAAIKEDAAHQARLEKMLQFPSEVALPTMVGPCNIRCRFCEQAYSHFSYEAVDFEIFKLAVAALPESLFLKTQLTPYLEPLAAPEHTRYLKYLLKQRPDLNVGFNTNGSHLTRKKADMFVDLGLKYLVISLNMPDAQSYKWFTGRDYFHRVVQGIKFLHEAKIAKNAAYPSVTVQFLKIPPVLGREKELRNQWLQYADHVYFRNVAPPSGVKEKTDELRRKGAELIPPQVIRPETWPCISLYIQMTIDFEGVYRPCNPCYRVSLQRQPYDISIMRVGSVHETDLLTAWRSDTQNKLRALQIANLLPICRCCESNQTNREVLLDLRNAVFKKFYREHI